MTAISYFDYNPKKQLTCQKFQGNDNYLWIAHAKNNSGNCLIQKVFAFYPSQVFYTLTRAVDKVVKMTVDSTYLYVAYEDDIMLGEIFTLNNPLSTTVEIAIPSGVVEYPVDIAVDGTYIYFLLPGSISGTNAQILKYDLVGNYVATLDLSESSNIVINAKSITIDSATGDIWIATYESPSNIVRVYQVRVIA